tara:strand:+ start:291 stop:620 length:330 start_codon:yes stop_codon:yes gene_type:complete
MTLIRIATLIVLITLNSGCAALTVRTYKKYPKKCTTHYFAPIADTLLIVPPVAALAVLPTAIALSSNSSRDEEMQILVSTLTFALVAGFSASHGYSEVSKCRRELKKIR